jgi:hypothetical protein
MKFDHIGVPSSTPRKGEVYIEAAKVHVTSPDAHPYRVEFLRFEKGSPMPAAMQQSPHTAFCVDDLAKALKGEKILVEPFDATPTLRVAFIQKDGLILELMQSI